MALREEEYDSIEASELSPEEKQKIYREKDRIRTPLKLQGENPSIDFIDFMSELSGHFRTEGKMWGDLR